MACELVKHLHGGKRALCDSIALYNKGCWQHGTLNCTDLRTARQTMYVVSKVMEAPLVLPSSSGEQGHLVQTNDASRKDPGWSAGQSFASPDH